MAFEVPYSTDTFRPVIDDIVPGNATADDPLEFDIAPAWGGDLARLKSVVFATVGLAQDGDWSPATQAAVIKAFETGAVAFVNTITAIRGLRIPAAMAIRAGILVGTPPGGPGAKVQVTTGEQFSRICGALTGTALHVATAIIKLSGKNEVDPRLFVQPSGSGGQGTQPARTSTAGSARSKSRRRGTAASRRKAASQQPGTSQPSASSSSAGGRTES